MSLTQKEEFTYSYLEVMGAVKALSVLYRLSNSESQANIMEVLVQFIRNKIKIVAPKLDPAQAELLLKEIYFHLKNKKEPFYRDAANYLAYSFNN